MALVLADRVQQTGVANTTVSFTLSGSVTGFQSFSVVGDTNTTYYSAYDASGNWEVGIGTYSTTGPTLTRTTILSSSNSGSAVTFSGTVSVLLTYPSGKSVNQDASGNVGIGTASPNAKLEVYGQRLRINGTPDPGLELANTVAVKGYVFYDATNDVVTMRHASSAGINTNNNGYVTIPNQVSFNAATTTSIGTGATVVPFTSTNHNIGGAFSTSTGRFTAPIVGRYLFTIGIAYALNNFYDIVLRKNGALLGNSQFGQNGGGLGYPQSSITQVIQLNVNDYIDVYLENAGVGGASRTDFTYFTGQLLG